MNKQIAGAQNFASMQKIKKLVQRYEKLSDAEKKKYNEQQTKDHFIRPLFEALGWDFEHEVWPETDVSGKRVDYAFKIDGITKFYIEAKAIPVNLDEERWAEQAINYSWHKSVPWVILTDFEAIKVFNTEWDEPDIQSCRYIEIPWTEFLTNEKLWWLSREAFQKGVLDKKADEVGKRPKKIIDEQLANDLIMWRELMFNELCGYNPKIDPKKISEHVQMILDRLIFIRTLEDRKIEDVILQPLARDWENKGRKTDQLLFSLNKVFRKIDRTYNSGLFAESACDYLGEKIEAMDITFADIINELYKTKNKHIRYNFADIPADIFGNIYEQYLGYIQKEDTKAKKTSKRKSQGIYYTPRYIVNYIVQNTLGEILKSKTPAEIKNLKILDPACGSGSFLISAYQSLIDYSQNQKRKQLNEKNNKLKDLEKAFKKRNGKLLTSQEKMRILLNNIFGVDLDKEAVELAKLNLLLKMVNSQIKLPKLSRNIQEGNSLISGSEKELKKYFGRKWQDKKAFEWEGKFDVVIGNPPYVSVKRGIPKNENSYYVDKFFTAKGQYDLFLLFIEQSFELLKEDGYFGFIIPKQLLTNINFKSCREFMFKNSKEIKIANAFMPFSDAQVEAVIVVCEKCKDFDNCRVIFDEIDENGKWATTSATHIDFIATNNPNLLVNINQDLLPKKLQIRFNKKSVKLEELFSIVRGLEFGKKDKRILKIKEKNATVIIRGQDLSRYQLINSKLYTDDKNINKNILVKNKILVRRVASDIMASLDQEGLCSLNTVYNLIPKNKQYSTKYILALLNSKLINYLFSSLNPIQDKLFPYIRVYQLAGIPIYKIDFSNKKEKAKHDKLVKLADKMLKLNKELQKFDPIMDDKEYKEIQEEIERVDGEIDERVFGIYGLGEEEIEVVERN